MFFYLYLIVDIYSRVRPLPRTGGGTGLTVGWEVHERESAELAAGLLERAVWAEGGRHQPTAPTWPTTAAP